jgi:hypothetical protein
MTKKPKPPCPLGANFKERFAQRLAERPKISDEEFMRETEAEIGPDGEYVDGPGIAIVCGTDQPMTRGAQRQNRTADTGIFNPLLYQLSYLGTGSRGGLREGRVLNPEPRAQSSARVGCQRGAPRSMLPSRVTRRVPPMPPRDSLALSWYGMLAPGGLSIRSRRSARELSMPAATSTSAVVSL